MICYSMLVNPKVLCVVRRVVLSHADCTPLLSFISVTIAPPYPLQDFKALYKCCIIIIIIIVIDVVDSWPHLGHIICKNSDDNLDILNRRSSFIAQGNDVICTSVW